jgi:MFS family permease
MTAKPRLFYGYIIVLATLLVMIVSTGALYSFGVFFKPVLNEFGWTRAQTSFAYSLSILVLGLLSIVMGRLNDRFGPRLVVSIAGCFLGVGYILMAYIGAIWQLYLFYGIIAGIGLSGVYVPPISTVARWFNKRRGLMTGIGMSGIGLGTAIMPPIANWLITDFGWRSSFTVIGIAVIVLTLTAAQLLRRDPSQMGLKAYGEEELQTLSSTIENGGLTTRQALATPQLWMSCVVFFVYGIFIQAIIVHIVPHATDIGIDAATATGLLMAIGLSSIFGRILVGSTGDHVGNRRTGFMALGLMFLAFVWLLFSGQIWMLYAFAIVFGFCYGGIASLVSPITADLFGMASHGAILGYVFFAMALGEMSGPLLAGWIFDITGGYQIVFIMCTALPVLDILLLMFLKPRRKAVEVKPGPSSAGLRA